VHHAGDDLDDVAGAGQAPAQAEPEAHEPFDHLEALGLDRMDVRDRDGAARAKPELEGEQLAAAARRRVGEGEALAGDRVLERLSGLDHGPESTARPLDYPWPRRAD
jgi:hypothetical protein